MDLSRLDRREWVAMAGGLLLAIAVFLPWYDTGNHFGNIDGQRGSLSAWDALDIIRILLLLAAIAPFVLAYIVARGQALSWPRGELTMVIALTAFTLVLVRGVIVKPGEPEGQISLQIGWFVAVIASLLILAGALLRSEESEKTRKPPGVL